MNIIEAISSSLTEVTNLSSPYIARIYVAGKVRYQKPVDFRLKKIKIPLSFSDIEFIYNKIERDTDNYKLDAVFDVYLPPGSEFDLKDGSKLKLTSYGVIKQYNNDVYVDMFCTLLNEGVYLIENISSLQVRERVTSELNNLIESNEIIKSLLPEYSSNILKFNDEDIDAIKVFTASKILNIIDTLDYNERYYYMNIFQETLLGNYSPLPPSLILDLKEISEIGIKDKIQAGFHGVHNYFNPRYVFQWLIYIFENDLLEDELAYNKLYLVNKLGGKCKLVVDKNENDYTITFNTPDECNYNYILDLTNCVSTGSYIKYNIESIILKYINKSDGEIIGIGNVSSQPNNLKCVTEIFAILSASNYIGITLSEYYSNVNTLLESIVVESEPSNGGGDG